MGLPVLVVVGALGAQGSGVISAFTSSPEIKYHIRALTSNPSSEAAVTLATKPNVSVVAVDLNSVESILAAFQDADLIFANTGFPAEVFVSQGAAAAQMYEEKQGLNIVRAAAQVPTLRHLIWSTLPNELAISQGKYSIPHFQSKIPAEDFTRTAESRLADKTTYLRVGIYGSNVLKTSYQLIPVEPAKKHVMIYPCSPNAVFPFIGDEYVNVGLLARSIFEQPEKTMGRVVLGVKEMMSCTAWAEVVEKSLRRQGFDISVSFMECTLEAFETAWGALGTEIGVMFEFLGNVEFGGYTSDTGSLPILTPKDLGVEDRLLLSTEDRLIKVDWKTEV